MPDPAIILAYWAWSGALILMGFCAGVSVGRDRPRRGMGRG